MGNIINYNFSDVTVTHCGKFLVLLMDGGSGTSFVEEYDDGAARTFGPGTTFMQQFECDKFAEERSQNLYYPFTSRAEWELAAFLLRSDLSLAALDTFLSLNLVSALLLL